MTSTRPHRDGQGRSDPQPSAGTPATGEAAGELVVVYDKLRRLARQWFAAQPTGHTLQPTAIVHEAYLRLSATDSTWHSRSHFLLIAARAMRQVLIDHARRRQTAKRGGAWCRVELGDETGEAGERDLDVLALHDALERLAALSERQARIVELRFFGGLSVPETAEALGLSPRSVKQEWRMARAWLLARLEEADP